MLPSSNPSISMDGRVYGLIGPVGPKTRSGPSSNSFFASHVPDAARVSGNTLGLIHKA